MKWSLEQCCNEVAQGLWYRGRNSGTVRYLLPGQRVADVQCGQKTVMQSFNKHLREYGSASAKMPFLYGADARDSSPILQFNNVPTAQLTMDCVLRSVAELLDKGIPSTCWVGGYILELPKGVHEAAQASYNGISVRAVTDYVLAWDELFTRFDVTYGKD